MTRWLNVLGGTSQCPRIQVAAVPRPPSLDAGALLKEADLRRRQIGDPGARVSVHDQITFPVWSPVLLTMISSDLFIYLRLNFQAKKLLTTSYLIAAKILRGMRPMRPSGRRTRSRRSSNA